MSELSEPIGQGPIEFLHEHVTQDTMGRSEYGGLPGLIQPAVIDGAPGHADLTGPEKLGVIIRAGTVPAMGRRDATDLEDAIDPLTKIDPTGLSTKIA